jgi:hypothetical protein
MSANSAIKNGYNQDITTQTEILMEILDFSKDLQKIFKVTQSVLVDIILVQAA